MKRKLLSVFLALILLLSVCSTALAASSTMAPKTTSCSPQEIWNYLYGKIGNEYGVAGLMGNLKAESGLYSNNLQYYYESILGYTDDSYTDAVDNGTYENFANDGAGYGLAQWTSSGRKNDLLNYAKSVNASIGNLDMQLGFLWKELSSSYNNTLSVLKAATSVKQASDIVLTDFERPADQSSSVKNIRASYGQEYYDTYATANTNTYTDKYDANDGKTAADTVTGDQATESASVTDYEPPVYNDDPVYDDIPPGVGFNDVPEGAYYKPAVDWAVANRITSGTSATTFSPDAYVTRGQAVTFLWKAKGSPSPHRSRNPFSDVEPGEYYYTAVLWAVEQGITSGTGADTFSPDASVTRGQAVTFLWRAKGRPSPRSSRNPFGDVEPDEYYYTAVLWAVKHGITSGTSADTFSPDASVTRGQMVTFLYRT